MRVYAFIVCTGLSALLAGGCAPYRYAYDHRDELHRQDQNQRGEQPRRVERQRRATAPPARTEPRRPRRTATARPVATPTPTTRPGPDRRMAASGADRPAAAMLPEVVTPATTGDRSATPPVARAAETAPAAVQAAKPTVSETAALPTPQALPPPADAAKAAPLSPATRKEIEDGYRLLRAGFVKKARERFSAAMPSAAAEATLAEARSMDPTYLASVAFPDVEPDAEQAKRLYTRALMLGAGEAKIDLERLEGAAASAARNTPSAR